MTKGEMLAAHGAGDVLLASETYSCGKGKRLNKQCGRCVPCLIRQASFYHAGMSDGTIYHYPDLALVAKSDDVLATRTAAARQARFGPGDLERWANMAGPLPADQGTRRAVVQAVGRGVEELRSFLATIPWPR